MALAPRRRTAPGSRSLKVGLDARKADDFGIGTYIRGVVLAASRVRPAWEFVLVGAPHGHSIEAPNISSTAPLGGGYGPADIASLSSAARCIGADVFHAPHYVTPIGLDIPLVVTIHDCIHLRFPEYLPRPLGVLPGGLSRRYARWLMRRAPRIAEHVIAVSEATRSDVIDLLETDPGHVTTVHNGVDAFWSATSETEVSKRSTSIFWVGNPKLHKGLDVLLDAFNAVAAEVPSAKLVLAGAEVLDEHVASHPFRERIDCLGFVSPEQLRDLYRSAGVVCVPSRHEGFGLPALEAMAAGAPLIATAVGGVPEVVGDAGVLVPAESTSKLATELQRVLADAPEAERLGANARARAATFSWTRCAEATCRILEQAATR